MENPTYRFGYFSMSPSDRRLFRYGESVVPSPKAFDALSLLVRHHGGLVSRDQIFSTLWPGVHVTEANLTNIIVQLRKLLGRDAVQTVFEIRLSIHSAGHRRARHRSEFHFLLRSNSLKRCLYWVHSGSGLAQMMRSEKRSMKFCLSSLPSNFLCTK
jgi:hypothetical protein